MKTEPRFQVLFILGGKNTLLYVLWGSLCPGLLSVKVEMRKFPPAHETGLNESGEESKHSNRPKK